jgi:predicted transcriptional regulator of viral defense system
MRIDQIRNSVENEEIDYVILKSLLADYSNPRDKISRLIKSKLLTGVKKGIYIFGPDIARKPYSIETLANLIYGPSAISLEYALAWYGMIPERPSSITSVTTARNKTFKTPVGQFSYTHQNSDYFSEGVTLIAMDPTHNVLMATKEKSLTDLLSLSHACPGLGSTTELLEYLEESLRIERETISSLNLSRVRNIDKTLHNANVTLLREFLEINKGKYHA